jgi:hypothetical protein
MVTRGRQTMKNIVERFLSAMIALYAISLVFFIPYYNWRFAKEHGFVAWIFLGEVVATGKGVAWPLFVVKDVFLNPQETNPDYRHYMNSLIAFEEARDKLENVTNPRDVLEKNEVIELLNLSLKEARFVSAAFLDDVHPEFAHKYQNDYMTAVSDMIAGLESGSSSKFQNGINNYDEYVYWMLERKKMMKFPGF